MLSVYPVCLFTPMHFYYLPIHPPNQPYLTLAYDKPQSWLSPIILTCNSSLSNSLVTNPQRSISYDTQRFEVRPPCQHGVIQAHAACDKRPGPVSRVSGLCMHRVRTITLGWYRVPTRQEADTG